MVLTNEVLLGTDGWFEYGVAGPPETADIMVSGWFNFDVTDEIDKPSTGEHRHGEEIFHYWHRRK